MNQNMIAGERLTACPSCGQPTIVRDRVYTTDGYPYVHECPPAARKVPGERDFCICGALTGNGLCDGCKGLSVTGAAQRGQRARTGPVHLYKSDLARLSDEALMARIASLARGDAGAYEAARAEAKRRIQQAERDERERKRRAF